MAVNQFTPGPLHLFANITAGANQGSAYLGTCVTAPEQEGEKFKIPIMNDLSGRSVPFQLVQDGETWMVMATMNRFNYFAIQTLLAREAAQGGGNDPGSETGYARGTLYIGVSDWQLVVVSGYAGTPAAGDFGADNFLPGGRIFGSANIRKYKESTVGTRVLEIAMAIELQNVFNTTTRGFFLYNDMTPAEVTPYLALVT